jgi:hypothetical protein
MERGTMRMLGFERAKGRRERASWMWRGASLKSGQVAATAAVTLVMR